MTAGPFLSLPGITSRLVQAIGLNLLLAWAGYREQSVSISGAVVGVLIGIVIYVGAGGGAWVLLVSTFLAACMASRVGLDRKVLLGIEEDRGGRRGAGNALANCGVAAAAALAATVAPDRMTASLALAAALAAAGSDTVASEIGKAFGRSTFLVTTLGRARPGTPGAMSLEGTAAGVVSALALAALAAGVDLIPASAIAVVVISATVGAAVESVLAATLEGPGILNNDALNLINTAVAATVAVVLTM